MNIVEVGLKCLLLILLDVNLEVEFKNKKLGVFIKNLKKVYSEGKKLVVDNLSINFYEG